MSEQPHKSFQEALDELRRSKEHLRSVRSELQKNATKATSKDGMVTVTLDGRGEVATIAFNTAKFRKMAPAELGAVLVDTITKARAESRSRVINAYRSLFPSGIDIDAIMAGKFDPDKIFDNAVRRANELKPGQPRPVPGGAAGRETAGRG